MLPAFLTAALFASAELVVRSRVIDRDPVTLNLRSYLAGGSPNVVFGDSHAGNGANGLDDFMVFWQPGINIENLERWVTRYAAENEVERVVVQLAPHLFRADLPHETNYDAYLEGREPRFFALEERFRSSHHKYFLDALGLIDYDYQPFGIYQPNGTYPREGRWYDLSADVRSARMAVRIGQMSPVAKLIPGQTPALERMLEVLHREGSAVCVAVFPLALEYAEAMETNPAYVEALELFANLAAESGARYVDLSKAVTNPDHIFNQDHLNIEGGRAFGSVLEAACFG